MEDVLLKPHEYKYLLTHKSLLENQNDVKICVPDVDSRTLHGSDIIFATIEGRASNVDNCKKFMQQHSKDDVIICCESHKSPLQDEIPVITLSDSDSEAICVLQDNQNQVNRKRRKRENSVIDLTTSAIFRNENICEVTSTTTNDKAAKKRKLDGNQFGVPSHCSTNIVNKICQMRENSVGIYNTEPLFHSKSEHNVPCLSQKVVNNYSKRKAKRNAKRKMSRRNAGWMKQFSKKPPAEEFISLNSKRNDSYRNGNCSKAVDEELICLDQSIIEKPIPKDPKLLRPIVIDGSNVAREHGKADNTYSCKGIKLCVDFFLKRGHKSVTAFVPSFRRHCQHKNIVTTDQHILEELAKSSNVVFTPSRRINGKRITSYDDRFIVELAATNGGVILSNDHYNDLLDVSADFKKTIEERLLLYCFVGDLLMVPDDPLGREGPRLDQLLSFPESQ